MVLKLARTAFAAGLTKLICHMHPGDQPTEKPLIKPEDLEGKVLMSVIGANRSVEVDNKISYWLGGQWLADYVPSGAVEADLYLADGRVFRHNILSGRWVHARNAPIVPTT